MIERGGKIQSNCNFFYHKNHKNHKNHKKGEELTRWGGGGARGGGPTWSVGICHRVSPEDPLCRHNDLKSNSIPNYQIIQSSLIDWRWMRRVHVIGRRRAPIRFARNQRSHQSNDVLHRPHQLLFTHHLTWFNLMLLFRWQ